MIVILEMLMITSKNASIYYLNTSPLSLMYSPQNDYQGITERNNVQCLARTPTYTKSCTYIPISPTYLQRV